LRMRAPLKTDMHSRPRRIARFMAMTTYGGRDEAEAVIARVRQIHDRVGGTSPKTPDFRAQRLTWIDRRSEAQIQLPRPLRPANAQQPGNGPTGRLRGGEAMQDRLGDPRMPRNGIISMDRVEIAARPVGQRGMCAQRQVSQRFRRSIRYRV